LTRTVSEEENIANYAERRRNSGHHFETKGQRRLQERRFQLLEGKEREVARRKLRKRRPANPGGRPKRKIKRIGGGEAGSQSTKWVGEPKTSHKRKVSNEREKEKTLYVFTTETTRSVHQVGSPKPGKGVTTLIAKKKVRQMAAGLRTSLEA